MEYNTTRSRMLMPEYGRNVQRMVEYLVTIDDRAKRLRNAEAIIELMGTLNPHLKTIEDYKHKLWDHLYQMTDFSLDVDSPYPMPTREQVFKKPETLPYPQKEMPNKHLGRNLQALLAKAVADTTEEKKQGFTQAIGYYMKLAYTNWHKEPIHDDMIKNELNLLSSGKLVFEPGGFRVQFDNRPTFKPRPNNNNNNNNRNFKGNNNNNGGGGNNRNNNADGSSGGQNNQRSFGNSNGYNKNRKFNKKPK